MTSTNYKKKILDKVADLLKQRHFKKNGQNFKYSNEDLTYYIGFQSSKYSTSEILKLTFNTGIASELLYKLQGKIITTHLRGHYLKRIGDYLEQPTDKWWTIDSEDLAYNAAEEITVIISKKILPEFDTITKTEDLINIWMNGVSTDLANIETQEYLALLFRAQEGSS